MNLKYTIQVLKLMQLWLKVFLLAFSYFLTKICKQNRYLCNYDLIITSIDQMNVKVLLQNNTCMYCNASCNFPSVQIFL